MNPLALAKKLIQIQSLSGSELPMYHALSKIFKANGFKVKPIATSKNRLNLYAAKGKPRVMICSHIDTVPPYIPFREDTKYLYGRGACDTKGVIAAQLCAALLLTDISFLYVVGEEVDHIGAIDTAKKIPKVQSIIVGEPTENKLAKGTKGMVKVRLLAKGKAAHSAYPKLGHSAIDDLIDVLSKIRKLSLGKDKVLGEANLNIGTIQGGVAANVFAPSAQCEVMIRTVSPCKPILAKIQRVCSGKVKVVLEAMNDPIKLKTAAGYKTSVASFNTDLPYLKSKSKNLYLLGPGSILDAHGKNERISKKELLQGVSLYKKLISMLVIPAKAGIHSK